MQFSDLKSNSASGQEHVILLLLYTYRILTAVSQLYNLHNLFLSITIIHITCFIIFYTALDLCLYGAHSSVVVKALCYKPEGRRFNT
jgi:hypothetical protein